MIQGIDKAIPALIAERGALVSSADCGQMELAFAVSEHRFFVDADGMGYVLRPKRWRETAEKCVSATPNG